ncbi:MAG: hypothetical protein OHK0012_02490 [Synechococcales cyanobacterium]
MALRHRPKLNRPRALVGLIGLWLILAPVAGAQPAPGVWSGSGQILSGHGQGATVELILETWPGRIRSQSGPALDAPFQPPVTTIRQGDTVWQIEMHGDQMQVTVYRSHQIIRYQLQPDELSSGRTAGNKVPYSQPMATFAPMMQELIPVNSVLPAP